MGALCPLTSFAMSIFSASRKFKVRGIELEVYPMGLRHIPTFMSRIGSLMMSVNIDPKALGGDQKAILRSFTMALPMITSSCIDIFYSCCKATKFDLETNEPSDATAIVPDLPHYEMVECLQYWIEESFGSVEKLKPWIRMIETLIEKATGQKMDLLNSLSNSSSTQDTPSTISST
jgi:hypothetical protein